MVERAEDARSNKSRRGGQAHLLAQVERGPGWACLACWQSPTCRWAQTQSNGLQRHPDMPCSQNYRCTLLLMTSCGVSTKHDRGMGYILDLPPHLGLAACQADGHAPVPACSLFHRNTWQQMEYSPADLLKAYICTLELCCSWAVQDTNNCQCLSMYVQASKGLWPAGGFLLFNTLPFTCKKGAVNAWKWTWSHSMPGCPNFCQNAGSLAIG